MEIRALIRRLAMENPSWGAPKIHGELLKLGFEVAERTVARYLQHARRRGDPARRWLAFLANHREVIVAMDFFSSSSWRPTPLGHLIPWSAAVTRLGLRSTDESPLPIVTVPALRLAGGVRSSSSSGKGSALVVGNPRRDLMFAESEARAVAEKLKTKALIGPQATKESVLNRLAEASVVHLATHGRFSVSLPMDSGVILADGVLTAREVMRYRLRTDLLVLSACQTGLGASLGSDELTGLSRAFMYAGVRTMLVSLWKVDDMATAALMTAFYDAWCGGSDKAGALSQAMKRVRAEKRWEHSYYWGAFALMGHWN